MPQNSKKQLLTASGKKKCDHQHPQLACNRQFCDGVEYTHDNHCGYCNYAIPITTESTGAVPTTQHEMSCPKLYGKECNCNSYPIQPDSPSWEEFIKLVREGHEAVINHEEVKEYELKVKTFFHQVEEKARKSAYEEIMKEVMPLVKDILKREDERMKTAAKYRRPFDATVKGKALCIERIILSKLEEPKRK